MKKSMLLLEAAFLAVVPVAGAAQSTLLPGRPLVAAQAQATRAVGSRNQIAVELGVLTAGLSYARRLGATPLSLGVGVWGAWEPPNTFDRNVWEPLGIHVFGRYRPTPRLHTDIGVAAARYVWADDCSGCSGTFVGLRSALLAGYRFMFIGPELSVGRASDDQHGSDFGVIWGAQVRFILGWER
jgi:hypothetical protein